MIEDEDDNDYEPTLDEIPPASAHAHISPQTRLERVLHSLEEQFGNAVTPIEDLTLLPASQHPLPSNIFSQKAPKAEGETEIDGEAESIVRSRGDGNEEQLREIAVEAAKKRLAKLGLTCPGVEVRVDDHVARVWFEGLEVDCKLDSLRMRDKTVVERAVEGVAPLVDLGLW